MDTDELTAILQEVRDRVRTRHPESPASGGGLPDLMPLLHARDAGAQAIACWSDSTGLDARMMNARGRIGWDVVMAGHPALGSGDVAHLLEKPEYWNKV